MMKAATIAMLLMASSGVEFRPVWARGPQHTTRSAEPNPRVVVPGGNQSPSAWFHTVPARYPRLARAARIEGDVTMRALVVNDGTIIELQVLSGHPLLIQAAMDAAKQWRHRPFAQPELIKTIKISFRLPSNEKMIKTEK